MGQVPSLLLTIAVIPKTNESDGKQRIAFGGEGEGLRVVGAHDWCGEKLNGGMEFARRRGRDKLAGPSLSLVPTKRVGRPGTNRRDAEYAQEPRSAEPSGVQNAHLPRGQKRVLPEGREQVEIRRRRGLARVFGQRIPVQKGQIKSAARRLFVRPFGKTAGDGSGPGERRGSFCFQDAERAAFAGEHVVGSPAVAVEFKAYPTVMQEIPSALSEGLVDRSRHGRRLQI